MRKSDDCDNSPMRILSCINNGNVKINFYTEFKSHTFVRTYQVSIEKKQFLFGLVYLQNSDFTASMFGKNQNNRL